jgi:hypothetical protein
VADNPSTASAGTHRSTALRFPLGRSGLIAAAAAAGAIVYWRAGERKRSRRAGDEIDDAILEGREAAAALMRGGDAETQPFDQR